MSMNTLLLECVASEVGAGMSFGTWDRMQLAGQLLYIEIIDFEI